MKVYLLAYDLFSNFDGRYLMEIRRNDCDGLNSSLYLRTIWSQLWLLIQLETQQGYETLQEASWVQ